MSTKLNVNQRIHKVMVEMKTINKNGYNKFHQYKYATETDYVEALRPLLEKHGLVVSPRILEVPSILGPDEKGNILTTILIEFKLTNVDNPQDFSVAVVSGQGSDKGDKGIYKALTGAKKYWAALTFMVETGDDPERDSGSSKKKNTTNFKRKVSTDDEF